MLLEAANIIFFLICTTKNVKNAVFDKIFSIPMVGILSEYIVN